MTTHLSLALRNEWHNELRNRHILFPAEHFLSFTTFFPLINQGIHFFGFCHYHSFLLENYKGFNNAQTCSWSGGYTTTGKCCTSKPTRVCLRCGLFACWANSRKPEDFRRDRKSVV